MSNARPFATRTISEILDIVEEDATLELSEGLMVRSPAALEEGLKDLEAYVVDLGAATSEARALAENLTYVVAELRLRAHSEAA